MGVRGTSGKRRMSEVVPACAGQIVSRKTTSPAITGDGSTTVGMPFTRTAGIVCPLMIASPFSSIEALIGAPSIDVPGGLIGPAAPAGHVHPRRGAHRLHTHPSTPLP